MGWFNKVGAFFYCLIYLMVGRRNLSSIHLASKWICRKGDNMKKIELGKSGIQVTQLGLGCINFGTTVTADNSFRLMDAYLEKGGNFFDTSNNYAFWNGGEGRDSEKTIGKWISSQGMRDKVILATKLGAIPLNGGKNFDDIQGNGRKVILEEVEQSLETLRTNYIDLLYLHVDDFKTPLEETMEALDEVVKSGKVRAIGCSNFDIWRVERARVICEKYGYPFFSAIQQRFSYLEPAADADFGVQRAVNKDLRDYIEYYKDLTMVSHTPLLYGLYHRGVIDMEEYDTGVNRKKLEELKTKGKNLTPWILNYITEQFGGSVVLFTTSSVEHLIENIEGVEALAADK